MSASTRSFGIALACVAALGLGLRWAIASDAWFKTDDFYFLYWVQSRAWSWSEVFLPTYARGAVLAYRPLGLEAYFFANYAAFGWNAFGYYVTALVLQLATAAVVYRIARQERYERPNAWVAAAIVCFGGPSLIETYAVAEHNYLCAGLFYALTLSLFLDQFRRPGPWPQLASCLALILALLSNDVALTAAPLLFGLAFVRSSAPDLAARAISASKRSWPQLLTTALFVDFRIWGVPLRQSGWFYEIDLGFDMLSNTLGNLAHATGGGLRLALLLLLSAAAAGVLWRERSGPSWIGLGWLAVCLVPFAVLAFPASRFALALLPALALCIAAVASILVEKLGSPRLRAAALVGVVALCVPWEDAVALARESRPHPLREAHAVAKRTLPADPRSCVTVLCGPGLANPAQCYEFRALTFGGALFHAVVPDRAVHVEIEDSRVDTQAFIGRDCLYYELQSDRSLVVRDRFSASPEEELSRLN